MGANSRGGLLKTFCSRVGSNSRGGLFEGGANSRIYGTTNFMTEILGLRKFKHGPL